VAFTVTYFLLILLYLRGPFEKFVDWRQCAAVMQRKAVTVVQVVVGGGG
jgi:hypothetical protein